MNKKALQKAIDALNLGTPDKICFALGILETLIESLPEEKVIWNPEKEQLVVTNRPKMDEASILDARAKQAIAAVAEISKLQTQQI